MNGLFRTYLPCLIVFSLLVSVAPFRAFSAPLEQLIVSITLNGEKKGDFIVHRTSEGVFALLVDDLRGMGLQGLPFDGSLTIDGAPYLPLNALEGAVQSFDQKKLVLAITLPPTYFPRKILDQAPSAKRAGVIFPEETSAFLNYSVSRTENDLTGDVFTSVSNKAGVRFGPVLLLSDSVYRKTEIESSTTRLMSSLSYERRDRLDRVVLGDAIAFTGELGSTVNLGGVSYSKSYQMDPYLIKQPMYGVSGVADFPSDVLVYLDGVLLRREHVAPGEFEFKNINYFGGAHNISVVVRDPFGNERTITNPVYFSDTLLGRGLHDFAYHAGFLRRNYGVESNDYGDWVVAGRHRYGLTDHLTVGGHAEARQSVVNAGPEFTATHPRLGVLSFSYAGSSSGGNQGHAVSLGHSYQFGTFSTHITDREFTEQYATIQTGLGAANPERIKSERGIGAGFALFVRSMLALDYTRSTLFSGEKIQTATATYSRTFFNTVNAFLTYRQTNSDATGKDYEIFVGVNYYPAKELAVLAQHRTTQESASDLLQVQNMPPVGEGFGYRATMESQRTDTTSSERVNPYLQYSGRYGVYSADYQRNWTDNASWNTYTVTAAGSVVYAGGVFGMARPVNDSFSFVQVGEIPNVAIQSNGAVVGETNRRGRMVLPELRSYSNNQITLDPSNIPMDVQLAKVNVVVSPPSWSGSCLVIQARKLQAYTGYLKVAADGADQPVEFNEVTLAVKGQPLRFLTGKNGEFYFENDLSGSEDAKKSIGSCKDLGEARKKPKDELQPGTYPGTFYYRDQKCTATITIPQSEDVILDLGSISARCGAAAPAGQVESQPVVPTPAPAAEPEPMPAPPAGTPKIPAPISAPVLEDNPPHSVAVRLQFDKSGNLIYASDRKAVASLVRHLKKNPDLFVAIEVYGDRHGAEDTSKRAGLKHVDAIRKYLISAGVSPDRIKKAESMGSGGMLCPDASPACDKAKRRGVIRLVRSDGTTEPTGTAGVTGEGQ